MPFGGLTAEEFGFGEVETLGRSLESKCGISCIGRGNCEKEFIYVLVTHLLTTLIYIICIGHTPPYHTHIYYMYWSHTSPPQGV